VGLKAQYDAIVFGGGPAGAAAALALARKGLSVVLVAKRAGSAPRIGETVPPEIVRVLARLGLWDRFLAQGHAAAPGIVSVWGDDHGHENDFLFNPYGSGWHLDRARFDAMLLDAARAAGADIGDSPVLACWRSADGGWSVRINATDGARTLVARWAIDATGRAAWLARRAGARRERSDRLVALARFASVPCVGEARTLIEACPHGWWYAAALPENGFIAALFTDSDLLPRGALARRLYWDQLYAQTRLLAEIVPCFRSASPLHTFAVCSGRSSVCVGPGWLAVGDAAQSYDPLSGQGIVKALTSALHAADVISIDRPAPAGIEDYRHATKREYDNYLAQRLVHYRREQRWSGDPFWNRRHQSAGAGHESGEAISVSSRLFART
jgi:flavin-dependent dehydrogenase